MVRLAENRHECNSSTEHGIERLELYRERGWLEQETKRSQCADAGMQASMELSGKSVDFDKTEGDANAIAKALASHTDDSLRVVQK